MKKVLCIVKESEYDEFIKEVPEILDHEEVEIKIMKDEEFDEYIKLKNKDG